MNLIIVNEHCTDLDRSVVESAVRVFVSLYEIGGAEITVSFVRSEETRRINREFRSIDEATDVLSFPAPEYLTSHLGDVLVNLDFAERQAEARGVSLSDEAAMLTVHGCLHLAGYDDESEDDRDDMVRRMNEVMSGAGLSPDANWHSLPHGEPLG